MTVRAVIWDIDGTLVDSEPLHLRALLATCAAYHADISDLPDDEFVGVNLHGVWEALKDRFPQNLSREQWIIELNHFYRAHSDMLMPMPQAPEVVKELSKFDLFQVAVSNSNRSIVDTNLEALKLKFYMQFTLSHDDVPIGKPSPIPYRMAISQLGLTPPQIIAVEDSPSGVQSASAAGLMVLGFMHGQKHVYTTDHPIKDLTEIFDYLTL